MAVFGRTKAVLDKTLKDLNRVSFWIAFAVQIVFLVFYGIKIYTNINHIVYLIIYTVLASIAFVSTIIFFIASYPNKKRPAPKTMRAFRIAKYICRIAVIVVALVELAQMDKPDLDIIVTGISIVSLLVQVIFEIMRIAFEKYAELFSIAFEKDVAAFGYVLNPKSSALNAIDGIIENATNKLTGKPKEDVILTEKEQFVEDLASEYISKKEEEKNVKNRKIIDNIKVHSKGLIEAALDKLSKDDAPTDAQE